MRKYKQYGINQPAVTKHKLHQSKLDETKKKKQGQQHRRSQLHAHNTPAMSTRPLPSSTRKERPPSHDEINIKLETSPFLHIIETVNGPQPSPAHTPRILRASWISFCMIVTRFACSAHRFVSSNRWTRNASAASWRAWMACDCQRNSAPTSAGSRSSATSRTKRAKGSLAMSRS